MIRKVLTMLAVFTLAMMAQAAAQGAWTPDNNIIKRLEDSAKVPGLGNDQIPISKYVRYYAGTTQGGRKMIQGEWVVSPEPPSIHVVEESALPRIVDGGCGIVNLLYDVEDARIVYIYCNGRGP
jgi:hypothetical protein